MSKTPLVKTLFLDSGAFGIQTEAAKYAREHKCGPWDFYDTDEFREYMDAYAAFVKKHNAAIDFYANMDVIGNPDLTLRNQRYLEKKGLRPVPVVHYRSDMTHLQQYIDEGYDYIGLGGMAGNNREPNIKRWLDKCFHVICGPETNIPTVRVHGFAITNIELLARYPWYSVDSSTWLQTGRYGNILVPRKRGRHFVFNEPPRTVKVSTERIKDDEAEGTDKGQPYDKFPQSEKRVVREWLRRVRVPLGINEGQGPVREGVAQHYSHRAEANARFFEEARRALQTKHGIYEWQPTTHTLSSKRKKKTSKATRQTPKPKK